jgi:adenylate kinase family enzyme
VIEPEPGAHPGRIAVVGTSGSGKTTLAHEVAQRLDIPHVELDAIHWGSAWTPLPLEIFRHRTEEALKGDSWTCDGNYSKVRDIVWGRANLVVWLDYPLPVVMGRVVTRTVRRCLMGEELWNGNRERVVEAVFGRDSIVLWSLRTYARRRKEYPFLFSQPQYAHLRVLRLQSPHVTREWLSSLPTSCKNRQATGGH